MNPVDRRHFVLRDALVGQVLRGSAGTSYYLRELIGEGGQGWVFKANWDEPGGIVIIVKALRPDVIQPDSLARFRREAEVLRLLSQQPRPNPYIVRFFDHAVAELTTPKGETVSLPFTVLEFVSGPTLERVLAGERGRGLGVERVRRLGRQAVQALELVHSQQIVHRDLKPSNVLLAMEGGTEVAKITDFGIVKRTDMNLKRTTTLAGASLGYAPPEQYEQGNDRVTPKTDLFSLAAILYEMLTGQMAFPFVEQEHPLLIVTRILNGPRPELMRLRGQLAPELAARSDLIRGIDRHLGRAMSADPANRQESVVEFWGQIEPLLREVASAAVDAPSSMLPFASTEAASGPNRAPIMEASTTQRSSAPSFAATPPVRVHPVSGPLHPVQPPRLSRSSDPVSNPAAWAWRILSRSIQDKILFAGSFSPAGDSAVAVGPKGLARWARGSWNAFSPPPAMDARDVRGVKLTTQGDLILFGERSLAGRVSPNGVSEIWRLPARDFSIRAAHLHGEVITLVGARPPRPGSGDGVGAAAQFAGGSLVFAWEAPSVPQLNGVTRLESGAIVAVGDRGALARLDRGAIESIGAICSGHLVAVEALTDGGAVTVGGGGHALYISPRLDAQLEAVQTTRDLCALAVGGGVAWAGAAQARLLRREASSWVRMSGDVGITPRIVAIWTADSWIRAVCDDGAVLEGRAA
jgi:eukaryotic-like serine/threonine-protein kinase